MASPSTVITEGYGSFGSVNLLPTLGFGIGAAETGAAVSGTASISRRATGTATFELRADGGTAAIANRVSGTASIEGQ